MLVSISWAAQQTEQRVWSVQVSSDIIQLKVCLNESLSSLTQKSPTIWSICLM